MLPVELRQRSSSFPSGRTRLSSAEIGLERSRLSRTEKTRNIWKTFNTNDDCWENHEK